MTGPVCVCMWYQVYCDFNAGASSATIAAGQRAVDRQRAVAGRLLCGVRAHQLQLPGGHRPRLASAAARLPSCRGGGGGGRSWTARKHRCR